jgi:5'-AMP-activated protein kinase regulatory gamma subunit
MSGADAAANFAPLDAPAFVAPKHLLSRPTVSPADKEQIEGLVSLTCYMMRCAGADIVIEDHSRISEGEDKLRRAAH